MATMQVLELDGSENGLLDPQVPVGRGHLILYKSKAIRIDQQCCMSGVIVCSSHGTKELFKLSPHPLALNKARYLNGSAFCTGWKSLSRQFSCNLNKYIKLIHTLLINTVCSQPRFHKKFV